MGIDRQLASGPIVACDNAIDHYAQQLAEQAYETDLIRKKLAAALDKERELDGKLQQWTAAKAVLAKQLPL